jgi:hypothetical protein
MELTTYVGEAVNSWEKSKKHIIGGRVFGSYLVVLAN